MDKLYHGAAYYPELWDDETISKDIELMKEAGINVVRMAEFAWSSLEPHQDEFRVDVFSKVIDLLYKNGIETIICTPTPTPPIWISHNHPERMIVDADNVTMSHGGRQQVCTNNAFLRERSRIIVGKMSKEYGNKKGVIGWQIDNELKGNVAECYCESCKALWHAWLKNKYETIETLNDAWGTHIWSQYYEDFSQVPQPLKTPMNHNPSLTTAYQLFSRDMVADFIKEQAEIIKKYSNQPITHNSSFNHFIDNETAFKSLDFASFDHYSEDDEYYKILSWIDTFKTLKQDKPFWVMETAPSFSGAAMGHQKAHRNGYVRAEAMAAYASGAQGFCYWLWRQHKNGIEQAHGHVLSAWGGKSIGFNNAVAVGKVKNVMEKAMAQTTPAKAELAITYSDIARAYFFTEPLEAGGFDYAKEMMNLYNKILKTNIHRDLIYEHNDLKGYKLLFTPYMPYVSDEYKERAKQFVLDGGTWIVGPLTGHRTKEHGVQTKSALGDLEEFAGVKVTYNYPMTRTETVGNAFEESAELSLWSSVFDCIDAKIVGTTQGGNTPELPFITECQRGKGKVVMLGSMPTGDKGEKLLNKLILNYANEAGISDVFDQTEGTIVIPRVGKGLKQWVVVNMDGNGGQVTIDQIGQDAITKERIEKGVVEIEPYGYKMINFEA